VSSRTHHRLARGAAGAVVATALLVPTASARLPVEEQPVSAQPATSAPAYEAAPAPDQAVSSAALIEAQSKPPAYAPAPAPDQATGAPSQVTAAPVYRAAPAPDQATPTSTPAPVRAAVQIQPAPTVTASVDEGFDWGSAAIGAGIAGALLLLFAAGASVAARHGHPIRHVTH
jgi:hypothetical protein